MSYCWFYLERFRRSSHTNRQKLPSSTTPLSFDASAQGNPREYPHKPCISRNYGLHFCHWWYGSIFIHICAVGSKRSIFSATECVLAVQGHSRSSKVDDFGTNRKRVCDFLLVFNSNFGPILHRFRDAATYWLKIAYFSYPSLIRRPRSLGSLWNFVLKLTTRKLESWGRGYPTVKTSWS